MPTIQRHANTSKTFSKAKRIKYIFTGARCACYLITWRHLPNDSRLRRFFLLRKLENLCHDVNSTSGDSHHYKIPLLICNWIFTYSQVNENHTVHSNTKTKQYTPIHPATIMKMSRHAETPWLATPLWWWKRPYIQCQNNRPVWRHNS